MQDCLTKHSSSAHFARCRTWGDEASRAAHQERSIILPEHDTQPSGASPKSYRLAGQERAQLQLMVNASICARSPLKKA